MQEIQLRTAWFVNMSLSHPAKLRHYALAMALTIRELQNLALDAEEDAGKRGLSRPFLAQGLQGSLKDRGVLSETVLRSCDLPNADSPSLQAFSLVVDMNINQPWEQSDKK